jgi:hypothetical protein
MIEQVSHPFAKKTSTSSVLIPLAVALAAFGIIYIISKQKEEEDNDY